jgi:hypothetical protein
MTAEAQRSQRAAEEDDDLCIGKGQPPDSTVLCDLRVLCASAVIRGVVRRRRL